LFDSDMVVQNELPRRLADWELEFLNYSFSSGDPDIDLTNVGDPSEGLDGLLVEGELPEQVLVPDNVRLEDRPEYLDPEPYQSPKAKSVVRLGNQLGEEWSEPLKVDK